MADSTQLTSEAAKLLEDLRLLLEKGGQFVLEQAPPLAREIVAYGRISNVIGMLVASTFIAICARWFLTKYAAWKEDSGSLDFPAAPLAAGIVGLGASIFWLCCAAEFAKAVFAPRLFLLQVVTGMLGGGCK